MVYSPRSGHIDYLTFLAITVSLFIGAIGTDEWEYTQPKYLGVLWFGALCIGYDLFLLAIGGSMASIYYSVSMGGMALIEVPTILALLGLIFTFAGWTIQFYVIGFDKVVSKDHKPADTASGPVVFVIHVVTMVLLFCGSLMYWRHIVSSHARMVADQVAKGFDPGITPLLNRKKPPPPVDVRAMPRRW